MPTGSFIHFYAPEYSNDLLQDMVLCLLKLRSVMLCLVTVPNAENNVQNRMSDLLFCITCNVSML